MGSLSQFEHLTGTTNKFILKGILLSIYLNDNDETLINKASGIQEKMNKVKGELQK